ncbi:MAG: hypothetical protein JSU70_11095 [Phycisphaerales bacterium]|nr:MAG: hypothetical protein JSU70_11095 [Phycisphaerales bacterium]
MNKTMVRGVVSALLLLAVAGASSLVAPAEDASANDPRPGMRSHFDRNGFLKVAGTPRLIIGLYELPKDDAKLREIADNGFNLVRAPQKIDELDRLHKHGLSAWICLGSAANLNRNDREGEERLRQVINKFKDHPALLVWELPDEAVWNIWWSGFSWIFGGQQRELRQHIEKAKADASPAQIAEWMSLLSKADRYGQRSLWEQAEAIYDRLWDQLGAKNPQPDWRMSRRAAKADEVTDAVARGCRVVRQTDRKHIIWQNHAPRNSVARLRKYNEAVDAAGCDIYPVPFNYGVGHSDLKDTNLSSVGAYTDRMREAAPVKAIWMVLQGFGWRDLNEKDKNDPDRKKGRRPSFHEIRFMAYDAILHGSNAILYWGTHSVEKDSALWRNLMKTARELRALEPAILGERPETLPTAVADETHGSIDGEGPRLMLRKTDNDWVLTAANEHAQGISFTIGSLPTEMEGKMLYRLYSDESQVVRNRAIHDGIRGFGVHVYATSRRFESR